MKIINKDRVASLTVNLNREDLCYLVMLGGYIGGEPTGHRGKINKLLGELGEAASIRGYLDAQDELGVEDAKVKGSVYFTS